ncbi:MAG: Crotonobetaine/carnitine--CoA ligase [Acidimicrobiales bacterium]|nr:MAG: ATP-dependent acyl-CoA ligase [Actinomycetota bacterium]MBV6509354.1 Crotonobetaine/carnitine--CoA ligase [Acidimicrobiales bacterium]RIK04610.1 MAG: AMP-dependent synthetase [Acidobacteriota bacterium]
MSQATTLRGVIEEQAEAQGDRPFLYFEDRVLPYAELDRLVNRVANGLLERGASPGTGVAIMMPNSPEWILVYFATQKLGAYAVPVNVALKGEGLRHVLDHSDSTFLVTAPECTAAVAAVLPETPGIEHVVVHTGDAPGDWERPTGWHALADLMEAPDRSPDAKLDLDAISSLMYTSGTTGAPKGVINRYSSTNITGIRALAGMLQPDEVPYTCLPLFHANALFLTTVRSLVLGLPMVLSRRFSASRFWDEIRRYEVTTFNSLGAMIPILMKQPERPDDADNPVRVVFSAACPADVWPAFEERFAVRLIEAYAAVDGGGFIVMNFGQSPKGSIGTPMNPFRIVDDDGNDVPAGVSGELLFEVDDPEARRVEYYRNEAASDDKIKDGWLHTGDLVHADEAGNLYFDDRKTDSLRRRGENVSSWEVERAISQHPAVLESAVFGVPSELAEDEVMAVVVLKEGHEAAPEDIVACAAENLASFAVPRYIEFRPSLPKTETHRVQKSVLKNEGITARTWDREAG